MWGLTIRAVVTAGLLGLTAGLPAGFCTAWAEETADPVPYWMVGRFFGANDKYNGRLVELKISAKGDVTGVVDGTEFFKGVVKGDRIFIDGAELIVTQTDDGLQTQEVDEMDNIVRYTRL
jgi:hypothetical protein